MRLDNIAKMENLANLNVQRPGRDLTLAGACQLSVIDFAISIPN